MLPSLFAHRAAYMSVESCSILCGPLLWPLCASAQQFSKSTFAQHSSVQDQRQDQRQQRWSCILLQTSVDMHMLLTCSRAAATPRGRKEGGRQRRASGCRRYQCCSKACRRADRQHQAAWAGEMQACPAAWPDDAKLGNRLSCGARCSYQGWPDKPLGHVSMQ